MITGAAQVDGAVPRGLRPLEGVDEARQGHVVSQPGGGWATGTRRRGPSWRSLRLAALAGEERGWVASVLTPARRDRRLRACTLSVRSTLSSSGRGGTRGPYPARHVVTGAIERGRGSVGEPVELIGLGAAVRSVVTSVERSGKTMEGAQAGASAALLLRSRTSPGAARQVAPAPGSLRKAAAPAVHAVC